MKTITITGVLELLDQGLTREQIATHYGISMKACKKLFQHPELKGKKAKKQDPIEFELVNDLVEETPAPQVEIQETQQPEEPQQANEVEATTQEELVAEEAQFEVEESNSTPSWEN